MVDPERKSRMMDEIEQKEARLDVAVGSAISTLQREHLTSGTSASRATLAQLRSAVDKEPGTTPESWERVMEVIPQSYSGTSDEPSSGEWAVHLALTFYAVHQQGHSAPMHLRGRSFGTACGLLMRKRADTPSTKARYDSALTASNFVALRYHLRGLIGLMNADGIGFDYGGFAKDVFLLQHPKFRADIIRRWGRDFYRAFTQSTEAENITVDSASSAETN